MEHKQQYKDFYYVLGITPDATTEEIRDAYGDLYEKYGPHVSVSGHDPDTMIKTFKDISEAYETLKVPARREAYDRRAYSTPGRRTRGARSTDQTMDDWPFIYVYAWWSGILWINCWYWWLNPEIWQADEGNL